MDISPETSPLMIYILVFLGPFVQEDAAVIAAGTLSATNVGKTPLLLIAIFFGLFFSDIWKYWIGWWALKNNRAKAFADKRHVADLKDKVQKFTFTTMIAARFIPLTRIPVYVACGFFHVPYLKFCIYIAITAVMYVAMVFTACHVLGAILIDNLEWALPVVGVTIASIIITGQVILMKYREKRAKISGEGE